MLEKIRNCFEIGVGVSDVFRNPPALNSAIGKDFCGRDHFAAFQTLLDDFRLQADPGLRCDIRLAFFGHGGQCRHRIAGNDFGGAAIAFFENEFVQVGGNFSGLPVHAGDCYVSTVGGIGCAA